MMDRRSMTTVACAHAKRGINEDYDNEDDEDEDDGDEGSASQVSMVSNKKGEKGGRSQRKKAANSWTCEEGKGVRTCCDYVGGGSGGRTKANQDQE